MVREQEHECIHIETDIMEDPSRSKHAQKIRSLIVNALRSILRRQAAVCFFYVQILQEPFMSWGLIF